MSKQPEGVKSLSKRVPANFNPWEKAFAREVLLAIEKLEKKHPYHTLAELLLTEQESAKDCQEKVTAATKRVDDDSRQESKSIASDDGTVDSVDVKINAILSEHFEKPVDESDEEYLKQESKQCLLFDKGDCQYTWPLNEDSPWIIFMALATEDRIVDFLNRWIKLAPLREGFNDMAEFDPEANEAVRMDRNKDRSESIYGWEICAWGDIIKDEDPKAAGTPQKLAEALCQDRIEAANAQFERFFSDGPQAPSTVPSLLSILLIFARHMFLSVKLRGISDRLILAGVAIHPANRSSALSAELSKQDSDEVAVHKDEIADYKHDMSLLMEEINELRSAKPQSPHYENSFKPKRAHFQRIIDQLRMKLDAVTAEVTKLKGGGVAPEMKSSLPGQDLSWLDGASAEKNPPASRKKRKKKKKKKKKNPLSDDFANNAERTSLAVSLGLESKCEKASVEMSAKTSAAEAAADIPVALQAKLNASLAAVGEIGKQLATAHAAIKENVQAHQKRLDIALRKKDSGHQQELGRYSSMIEALKASSADQQIKLTKVCAAAITEKSNTNKEMRKLQKRLKKLGTDKDSLGLQLKKAKYIIARAKKCEATNKTKIATLEAQLKQVLAKADERVPASIAEQGGSSTTDTLKKQSPPLKSSPAQLATLQQYIVCFQSAHLQQNHTIVALANQVTCLMGQSSCAEFTLRQLQQWGGYLERIIDIQRQEFLALDQLLGVEFRSALSCNEIEGPVAYVKLDGATRYFSLDLCHTAIRALQTVVGVASARGHSRQPTNPVCASKSSS